MKERPEVLTKKTIEIGQRLHDFFGKMKKPKAEDDRNMPMCDFSRHFEPVSDRRWGMGAARWS
jgi:hypothetical protein